jgi:preprotein translocase subunit SecE
MAKQNLTADREENAGNANEISSRSAGRSSPAGRKKDRQMTATTGWLFNGGLYKKTQGRIARQLTFAAIVVAVLIGCWRLSVLMMDVQNSGVRYGVPLVLIAVGGWLAFRLVNLPKFADFLIGVEAEMAKVSWPTRAELVRSSIVVMIVIFGLAAVLALYDLFWNWFLHLLTGNR